MRAPRRRRPNCCRRPDGVAGIYNLGAGNAGLIAALERFGMAGGVRVIAHELTAVTRAGLETGAIDVVIDQNPDGEIAAAIAAGPRRGARAAFRRSVGGH